MKRLIIPIVAILISISIGCGQKSIWPEGFEIPNDPADYLYARAIAESKNQQYALNIARNEIRVEIARQLESKIMAMKETEGEVNSELLQSVVSATHRCIPVKEEVKEETGGIYRVFVLMKIPISEVELLMKIEENRRMYKRFRQSQVFKKLEEEVEKYEQYKREHADYSEQKEVVELPDWFSNPPEKKNYLYGTGTAKSKDLRTAIRMAYEYARHSIAEQRSVAIVEKYSISSVSQLLRGCITHEQKVKQEDNFSRVYVLMEMPTEENKLRLHNRFGDTRTYKIYGYGFPRAGAKTEKEQTLSAHLAAIGDACREIVALKEIQLQGMSQRLEKSTDLYSMSYTFLSKSMVSGKVGNRLIVRGMTEVVYEDETLSYFNDVIKLEYGGHSIEMYSGQVHSTESEQPPDITPFSIIEPSGMELIDDIRGIEKVLEESGIKIEQIEHLDNGLCKVKLLLSDEFALQNIIASYEPYKDFKEEKKK